MGNAQGFSWVVRDISQKRHVVDGLKDAMATYSRKLAEATPDLQETRARLFAAIEQLIDRLEAPDIERPSAAEAAPKAPPSPATLTGTVRPQAVLPASPRH